MKNVYSVYLLKSSLVNLLKCSLAINCHLAVDSVWIGVDARQADRRVTIISLFFNHHLSSSPTHPHSARQRLES